MNITKAIIPVAGWGTRRLPITKAIEKCMLPLGNRPVVDYVVQDCIAAGITDIYFVVGEQSQQLHEYYRDNPELTDYLLQAGKEALLPLIATPAARFHYIVQPSYGKYGTAVPVYLALPHIDPDESVLVVMGDDCLYKPEGQSDIARLLAAAEDGGSAVLGVDASDDPTIPHYGFMIINDHDELLSIIDHPAEEPEHFIKNVSKYVLNPAMLRALRRYVEEPVTTTEYEIFKPFEQAMAEGEHMRVIYAQGRYLDAGTAEGWLHANQVVLEGVG